MAEGAPTVRDSDQIAQNAKHFAKCPRGLIDIDTFFRDATGMVHAAHMLGRRTNWSRTRSKDNDLQENCLPGRFRGGRFGPRLCDGYQTRPRIARYPLS